MSPPYDYDNSMTGMGRLTTTRYYNTLAAYTADLTARSAAVRRIGMKFDAYGRPVEMNDSAFGRVTRYAYDADGRLTKLDTPQGVVHYGYDAFGRKTVTWTGAGAANDGSRRAKSRRK